VTSEWDAEFDAFYRAEAVVLFRFLLRLGATPEDAADASGHAFTEMYVRWPEIRKPRAYLRRIAINELTALAVRPRTDVERAFRGCWALEVVEDVYEHEDVRRVLAALRKLPQRQREVLALHYDGYRAAEIAEFFGIARVTVDSHLRHAKTALRRMGVGDEG
jgi:RNA polymerase sigma factor (sigma-70 family)